MNERKRTSRLPGFHRLSRRDRLKAIASLLEEDATVLVEALENRGLSADAADLIIENVLGLYGLPFAVAPNFVINGRETLVPMVVEEPSVVAAAANAARMAREGGGFRTTATDPVMVCQIQLFTSEPERARGIILAQRQELLNEAGRVDQALHACGGGPVDLEVRVIEDHEAGDRFLVIHLMVDVRDAMGANTVNTMGEAIVPLVESMTGGRTGLCILSNLADHRLVSCEVSIPAATLAGDGFPPERVRDAIVEASRFAELDPYRAATHNKGIMNGIDAVVVATGNDWRAVEAGAHAYAARDGQYRPLCVWSSGDDGSLKGCLRMPLAVGIIGGMTRRHPVARLALRMSGVRTSSELACVAAAAGMANNLAALRALSTEGIQKGHMRLHRRSKEALG